MSATWDLTGLVPGGADEAMSHGRAAVTAARRFADTYRGRVAALEAEELAAACGALEEVVTLLRRGTVYAALRFDGDGGPPDHGALLTQLGEAGTDVATTVIFFDLEWSLVDPGRVRQLLADPRLSRYAHHLEQLAAAAPHRLSEPEERLLTQKARTGIGAWGRLLDEQLAGLSPQIGDEATELDEAIARLRDPDAGQRAAADRAVCDSLLLGLSVRARILNTCLADRALDDRLRRFPHWLAEFNLDNEATDAAATALTDAVVSRYDLAHRWFALKARVLGQEQLAFADVLAPLGAIPADFSWAQAQATVTDVYTGVSAELGSVVTRFFAERWIDAVPRPGKRTGAYCADSVPNANPFILLNFSGHLDDVLTLAHELGHGVHSVLAAPRGLLSMSPPLTLAETASVFGETLTFAHLLEQTETPERRFAMLAQQLDGIVWTAFRSIATHRFEAAIHTERREVGELSVPRFGELWLASQREMLGDAVLLDEDHGSWWCYIRHVFTMTGYVYSYAYGQLLALSLYGRYQTVGEAFVPGFLDVLRAGGSRAPDALLAEIGVDIGDPGFWHVGLGRVEALLVQAEAAAVAVTG